MSNSVLFVTSWVMLLAHALSMLVFGVPLPLEWVYLTACSTSIWNHGSTLGVALWCDRGMMAIGFAINVYFIVHYLSNEQKSWLVGLTCAAGASYTGAKACGCVVLHGFAHMMVIACNVSILYYLQWGAESQDSTLRILVAAIALVPLYAFGLGAHTHAHARDTAASLISRPSTGCCHSHDSASMQAKHMQTEGMTRGSDMASQ